MRGVKPLVFFGVFVLVLASVGTSAAGQELSDGSAATAQDGDVDLWAWVQVESSAESAKQQPAAGLAAKSKPRCYWRQGNLSQLLAWMKVDLGVVPDNLEVYVFKFCQKGNKQELVKFWVYRPKPKQDSAPVSGTDVGRITQEVWGELSIPAPHILMAPLHVTIVHIPTFVWLHPTQKAPVSKTITTNLEGNEITLTATAKPRRKGFLRIDMGDGKRLWCDEAEVVPFDISYDPFDQLSKCVHFYQQSSVGSLDLRYEVRLTAYWEVSVSCNLNGQACTGPLPVVPVQALNAKPHRIGVAEIQALGAPRPVI
ncbi:MAG: hypothetical protein OXE93_00895 [bacterium]|nr:hypothetical protein [bacterium]